MDGKVKRAQNREPEAGKKQASGSIEIQKFTVEPKQKGSAGKSNSSQKSRIFRFIIIV